MLNLLLQNHEFGYPKTYADFWNRRLPWAPKREDVHSAYIPVVFVETRVSDEQKKLERSSHVRQTA